MNFTINHEKKISPRLWVLALISLYGIWQMGVVFFSGTSLSLYGKTPININATYTTILIVAGYIATIVLNFFFFKKSILFGRIILIVSLVITLMMFAPVSSSYLSLLFYINAFCCTFLIGTNYAIETNLLDNKSELKFVYLCSLIVFASIVIMQGDFLSIPFFVFNIVSAVILIALIVVYFLLPKNIDTYEKNKKTENKIPVLLKTGVYLAIFVSTLCLVFGTAISETINYGVGIFYSIGVVFTLVFGALVFKKKLSPFKVYTFTFALSVIGFVFAILSIQFSWCVYPAIILIGASCLPANMVGFLSNTLFMSKPSRVYAPALVFCGFLVAILQAGLLELFRNNLSVLFSVISIIAIIILIIFVCIESSLTYHWHKITIPANEKNINTQNESYKNNCFALLSDREKEVVDCILLGYTNTEMSKIVLLSPQTIKSYRKNIYAKLNIHSRSELFSLANNSKAEEHKR